MGWRHWPISHSQPKPNSDSLIFYLSVVEVKKDGVAEMFKLLCGLTPLPLAKPSSISPDAGRSCLKPHVSAHSPRRFPGGRAGRMREATLHPTAWPHAACRRVCCRHMSDPCVGRYCCP